MDPWSEHPALWPDVPSRLIAAVADALSPLVAPKYYVGLEQRTNTLTSPEELAFIGVPDLSVSTHHPAPGPGGLARDEVGGQVLEVEIPSVEEIRETYLEIRSVKTRKLITLLEMMSPANKLMARGRRKYERKRARVLDSLTNLVEIDLLRAGKPMNWVGGGRHSDYRILISREPRRPRAQLFAFNLPDPIPLIHLPLLPGDPEPPLELGMVLHALYDRARFDLLIDYSEPPTPPLREDLAAWARPILPS